MGSRAVSCYEENERAPGPRGSRGPAGVGTPGPKGDDGLSAYEVALAEGFIGTEQEWLDSLVGPEGDASTIAGPQGPPGNDDIMPVTVVSTPTFLATGAVHKHLLRADVGTTVTIEANPAADWNTSFTDAPYFSIVQRGSEPVSIVGAPGVTILVPDGFLPQTREQGSTVTLTGDDVANNNWVLSGDLALTGTFTGPTGDSAYEIAVANGFVGTEPEWVASLASTVPGPQGPTGPQGAVGPQGASVVWTQVTQAQYDALSPPDPAILYIIVG